ncbi:MAG: gatA 7, partial [Gemmatimonadales bacterium]|nr:gatA 7 [Gemmatimonadales bacterium]
MPGSKKVVPAMIDTTEKDLPLCWWTARDLAKAIRNREASAVEVMRAHLDRISDVNDKVNVIVSMVSAHEALAAAEAADRAVARGDDLGPLHGLPTAVKDLVDVRGFPTTRGSSAYADAPPATRDSLLARRLREAGAIIIGKTNTPEHGVGTLTFNSVFGITRNPYDLSRHAGGSSSAAAALAAGMLPVADGSDSGGSLRYPSAFCNTVGLRTSAGRVPAGAEGSGWSPHGVLGPMARNSQDAGLILSAIAGSDENSPLSLTEDPAVFADIQPSELAGLRIAWSQDADGLPIDLEVRAAHNKARDTLASLGCVIDDLEPDFTDADECWEIIEMFGFFSIGREGVASHPEFFRADFIRNVRQGEALSATEIDRGLRLRADLF